MSAIRTGASALIAAAVLLTSTPAAVLADDEIGGDATPAPFTSPVHIDDLDTQIHFSVARLIVTDEDMSEQYDGMWLGGVEASFDMGGQTRFFLSGHYGTMNGDPYIDDPTFTGAELRLRALPFRVGLRLDGSANERLAVHWTAAYQVVWMSEETPVFDTIHGASLEDPSGWMTGLFLGVAPELKWNDGRRTARLEIGWSGFGGDGNIGQGLLRHDVSLSGIWISLGTSIQL